MMQKSLTVLTALAVMVGFAAATAKPAAADEQADYYRTAMTDLVKLTDAWSLDLASQVSAMKIKPEQACSMDYQEFVRRGVWLADDLQGSALSAPQDIAETNRLAGEGFRQMVDGATEIGQSCDGSMLASGMKQIDGGKTTYRTYVTKLIFWLNPDGIRSTPRIPIFPIH